MSWDKETSKERVEKADVPVDDIELLEPTKVNSLESIGTKQMAYIDAINLFVDICSYTKRTEKHRNKSIFRILNTFHKEMVAIAKEQKIKGTKIALQGDRVHIVFYDPKEDEKEIINNAIQASISMMTSIKDVINPFFENYDDLQIADSTFKCNRFVSYRIPVLASKSQAIFLAGCLSEP